MSDTAWLQTYFGHKFHPLDPQPYEIDIRDIIHALAHVNRFGGHTAEPYSVGQHSVLVMEQARFELLARLSKGLNWDLPESAVKWPVLKAALMHDASEAYLHDIPRPIKRLLPSYRQMENQLTAVINRKFNIFENVEIKGLVHQADNDLLFTEAMIFFGPTKIRDWHLDGKMAHPVIQEQVKRCWPPEHTRSRFHVYFRALFEYAKL